MKNLLFVTALGALLLTSCNKEFISSSVGNLKAAFPARPMAAIPVDSDGLILKNYLSKDTIWQVDGVSFVKPGSTLTIQAGTFITAGVAKKYEHEDDGSEHLIKGVLVVPKQAKLHAIGTAQEPIVFTSDKPAGQRNPGDFGGIVLLGSATTNQSNTTRIEGIPKPVNVDVTYGGAKPADNSGVLKYVRIEFAGYNLTPDNEINGLTCGGVGSGTTLENIQVSWGRDDAFEFFGGTVNAKYLVALSNDDDDYDFDFGYTGTIQYALSLKDPNSTNSVSRGISDSNGIESDNNGAGDKVQPFTRPNLKNFTFLGIQDKEIAKKKLLYGHRWRRASSLNITNSIIAGYDVGARFENITSDAAVFSDNVVHAYSQVFIGDVPGTANQVLVSDNAVDFIDLSGYSEIFYSTQNARRFTPSLLIPLPSSPAYGDGSNTFKGAFNPSGTIWTSGWTEWMPKTYE